MTPTEPQPPIDLNECAELDYSDLAPRRGFRSLFDGGFWASLSRRVWLSMFKPEPRKREPRWAPTGRKPRVWDCTLPPGLIRENPVLGRVAFKPAIAHTKGEARSAFKQQLAEQYQRILGIDAPPRLRRLPAGTLVTKKEVAGNVAA